MYIIRHIIFFLILICYSCNREISNEKNIQNVIAEKDKIVTEITENSGITIPTYTLVKTQIERANDDYINSFEIKFDSLGFQNVVSKIKKSIYYIDVLNPSLPPHAVLKDEKIKRWSKAQFGYKFEYFIDGTDKFYIYEVATSDYSLRRTYIEE